MGQELDLFIKNFENIDLDDDLNINLIAQNVEELIEPYRVNVQEVGLQVAQDSKAAITKLKNKIAKVFKAKRDEYTTKNRKIKAVEDTINSSLVEAEQDLKADLEAEHNRLVRDQRRLFLPIRKNIIETAGLEPVDDDVILSLNEEDFNNLVAAKLKAKEAAKKQLEEEEALRAKLKAEAEARADRNAKAEKERQDKENREAAQKAVKRIKIQEWLESHEAWDETIQDVKDGFRMKLVENTGYLFKQISSITLEG